MTTFTNISSVFAIVVMCALGRPLLVRKLDDNGYEYIKHLRHCGGVVNCTIVITAAQGIITHKNPRLLW